MTNLVSTRNIILMVMLTAFWCGLWGDISPGNVLGGLGVAMTVIIIGVGTPGTGGVRLIPLLHLMGLVAVDLIHSTFHVAVEIITPTNSTDESIIAVQVPLAGRDHLLVLVVAITLTPGTSVVDVDPDRGTLYLHLLHDKRRTATIEHTHKLARLACDAFPVNRAKASTS